ncbi:MAG: NAD-dependent epimerase/dehydratase family protein, partial [Bdellovibrionota bacterium]
MLKPPVPARDRCISLLGCGWLGLPLAENLIKDGYHVRGSTTRSSKLSMLSELGIEPLLMRIDSGDENDWSPTPATERFFESGTMIVGLPPQAEYGPEHFSSQMNAVLSRRGSSGFSHLVFLSSTSVYGSLQGAVDETSPLAPDTDSGAILLESERRLAKAAQEMGFALTIVRPGGLVGPGRHPGLFLAGRKDVKDPESPINLVHQFDCAAAIANLVTDLPPPGESRSFDLVANFHPTRREFYTQAATAIGVETPTFTSQ